MTVETVDNRESYAGNSVTTEFVVPFPFFQNEDLAVYLVDDTTLAATLKVLDSDYTLTGAGEDSGTLTMLSAPATGKTLLIIRDPELKQDLVLVESGVIPSNQIEKRLDRLTMIVQRLSEQTGFAVRLPDGFIGPAIDLTLPSDISDSDNAGAALVLNSDGDGLALGPTANDIADAEANAQAAADSADDAADSATLAADWAAKTNGQVATTDYSAKAWAIGGTGVTDTASRGAAKEWATETASTVDGTDYSAKEWAKGIQTRGAASGGSAKDWATRIGGTVDDTEFSAKKYAQDSAASAAAAAAALASAFFRDIVYKTSADSPVTITSADNGKLFVFDSSGGAIAVTMPQISTLTPPFNVAALIKTAGNNVTFSRSGSDLIGGAASKVLSVVNTGCQFMADTDLSPDQYEVLEFGSVGDNTVSTAKLQDGAVTRAKLATGAIAKASATATKTGDYTASTDDDFIPVDCTGGNIIITLYALSGNLGRRIRIMNLSAAGGSLTVDGNGSETINGSTTFVVAHEAGTILELEAISGDWKIVNHFIPDVKPTQYTPAMSQGMGTLASTNLWYSFNSKTRMLMVWGSVTTGTMGAQEARLALPGSYTIWGSIPSPTFCGMVIKNGADAAQNVILGEPGNGHMCFGTQGSGSAGLTKIAGTGLVNNGGVFNFMATFPVL